MSNRRIRTSQGRPFSSRTENTLCTTADGRRYPEIKQKGFYSDILPAATNQELGVSLKLFNHKMDIYHLPL